MRNSVKESGIAVNPYADIVKLSVFSEPNRFSFTQSNRQSCVMTYPAQSNLFFGAEFTIQVQQK
ncbi:hypothetical protein, partial [Neisseria sp. HMSC077D05]|uniref:hypothetical protein n=1 Tax=Neisseria sp. HMSC077D05 TaxID=1715079 RepID=UPI001AEF458B